MVPHCRLRPQRLPTNQMRRLLLWHVIFALVSACVPGEGLNPPPRKDGSAPVGVKAIVSAFRAEETYRRVRGLPRHCYYSTRGLSSEISGVMVTGGDVVEAPGLEPWRPADDFPYSNKYCVKEADHKYSLVPDNCHLDGFDPSEFSELFRGRRLILWGDSVTRQFFEYLAIRMRGLVDPGVHADDIGRALDELPSEVCSYQEAGNSQEYILGEECLTVHGDWTEKCVSYHDGESHMCFIRADRDIVNNMNVGYYNDLQASDIVLMNIGLHMNKEEEYRQALRGFAELAGRQAAQGRELPFLMFRDSSAQHFFGGRANNFPFGQERKYLKAINPKTFSCTRYPYGVMRANDFRNQVLTTYGANLFSQNNLSIPILRVWNVTANLYSQHPQYLGSSTKADCTHWCPNLGGLYEVWSTLFHNFLKAAIKSEDKIRTGPQQREPAASQNSMTGQPWPVKSDEN